MLAQVIGGDPDKDIAVLQLQAPEEKLRELRPVTLGTSTNLLVGQKVSCFPLLDTCSEKEAALRKHQCSWRNIFLASWIPLQSQTCSWVLKREIYKRPVLASTIFCCEACSLPLQQVTAERLRL